MTFKKQFDSLCSPAKLYLVIKGIAILILFVQNLREPNAYKVGSYKIDLNHHNIIFFLVKIVIMLVWTFVLNKFCSKGYKGVAWFLVMIPFILFFVAIGLVVVAGQKKPKRAATRPQGGRYMQQPMYQQQAPTTYQLPPNAYSAPREARGPPAVPVRTQQATYGGLPNDSKGRVQDRYAYSQMPQA